MPPPPPGPGHPPAHTPHSGTAGFLPGWTGIAGNPLHGRVIVGEPHNPPPTDAGLAQAAWFMRALIQLGWAAPILAMATQVAAQQLTGLPPPPTGCAAHSFPLEDGGPPASSFGTSSTATCGAVAGSSTDIPCPAHPVGAQAVLAAWVAQVTPRDAGALPPAGPLQTTPACGAPPPAGPPLPSPPPIDPPGGSDATSAVPPLVAPAWAREQEAAGVPVAPPSIGPADARGATDVVDQWPERGARRSRSQRRYHDHRQDRHRHRDHGHTSRRHHQPSREDDRGASNRGPPPPQDGPGPDRGPPPRVHPANPPAPHQPHPQPHPANAAQDTDARGLGWRVDTTGAMHRNDPARAAQDAEGDTLWVDDPWAQGPAPHPPHPSQQHDEQAYPATRATSAPGRDRGGGTDWRHPRGRDPGRPRGGRNRYGNDRRGAGAKRPAPGAPPHVAARYNDPGPVGVSAEAHGTGPPGGHWAGLPDDHHPDPAGHHAPHAPSANNPPPPRIKAIPLSRAQRDAAAAKAGRPQNPPAPWQQDAVAHAMGGPTPGGPDSTGHPSSHWHTTPPAPEAAHPTGAAAHTQSQATAGSAPPWTATSDPPAAEPPWLARLMAEVRNQGRRGDSSGSDRSRRHRRDSPDRRRRRRD